jgi:hypothetical protein
VDLEDLNNLHVVVKSVPFRNGLAPAVVIVSPDDEYFIDIEELYCLMDGLQIAQEKVSEIIDYIINTKTLKREEE